jgi:hypothetical protein
MSLPGKDNPTPLEQGVAAIKFAQILNLIKNNQLLTAAVVFVLWQAGMIADATSYVGGMC